MDYARYDNQVVSSTWDPDQTAPAVTQHQQQLLHSQPQMNLKPDPQTHPMVYTSPSHQPVPNYDVPISWTPQLASPDVIHVSHWPPSNSSIGHTSTIEPICSPLTDPCIHPTSHSHSHQSHYSQYSTLQSGPSYWTPDLTNSQPATLISQPSTTIALPASIPEPAANQALIDTTFTLNQPSVPCAAQPTDLAETSVVIPPASFDASDAIGPANHVEQTPPEIPVIPDPACLEDALEVIKSHAEHFSKHRPTCSSTSGDDDDDEHGRGHRGGEREKERRQANNARER